MTSKNSAVLIIFIVLVVAVVYFWQAGSRQAGETSAVIDTDTPFHFQAIITSIDAGGKLYFVSGFDSDLLLKKEAIIRRDATIQITAGTQFAKLEFSGESDGRGGQKLIASPAVFSDAHVGDPIMVKAAEAYRNSRVITAGAIDILPLFTQ